MQRPSRSAPPEAFVRRYGDAGRALAAAGVLAATSAVAARGLPENEAKVFDAIHGLPHWLAPVLWAPMQLGNAVAPAAVGAAAWWRWRRWRPAAGAAVVGLTGWYAAKAVKAVVDRGRPAAEVPELVRRSAPTQGLGFVSGHATVAFGVATVMAPYLPPLGKVGAYGLAKVVGFGRIHAGAHLPLDVVGGAALGAMLGWAWGLAVGVPAPAR